LHTNTRKRNSAIREYARNIKGRHVVKKQAKENQGGAAAKGFRSKPAKTAAWGTEQNCELTGKSFM